MIKLARSTYHYCSTAPASGQANMRFIALISDIRDELLGYGYRRVTREMHARGHIVNHKHVARFWRSTAWVSSQRSAMSRVAARKST